MPWKLQREIARTLLTGFVVVCLLTWATAIRDSSIPARSVVGAMGRPVALVQAGDSKTPCIYAGLGATLRRTERATRLRYNCMLTYNDADPTWAGWVKPWVTLPQYGIREWLAEDPSDRKIILTQDLIHESESSNPYWRADGAAGDFNRYARMLSENLVNSGFGYSVIRLGPEMNGRWEDDNLGHSMTQWHRWAAYFAQIVRTMRSVRGAHFLFDWNVNAGTWTSVPLADYYPGDAYVDIIGLDLYDMSGLQLPPVGSPDRWEALVNEPLGLTEVYRFAARHHKPLSFPEWATVSTQGDDGEYVAHMGEFIASHDVAYQSWFDSGDDDIYQLSRSEAPHSVAAYVQTISRKVR